jgi:hypothetical protein
MDESTFKKRPPINIQPNRQRSMQHILFNCSECFTSITKQECVVMCFCNKCKSILCVNCFDESGKCGNCFGKLSRFEKKDTIDLPETLNDFIPIKQSKRNWWCC